MKFRSTLVFAALMSFVVASGQQVSTLRQTVTTMAKGKPAKVETRQVRVTRKPAPAATKQRTVSPVTRVSSPAKAAGTKGPKRLRPSLLPGYPNVTINAQNFGSVAVGGTPASMTLTYTFPAGVTGLYTSFANGLDFSGSNSVCTSTGCSATFTFNPRYPGLAKDALVIVDQNNNPVYETLIYGTGTGPQFGFDLGGLTVHTQVTNQPDSIAVGTDGALYLVDASRSTVTKYAPDFSTSETLQIGGLGVPGGIAVDGDNTVYVADKTNNVIVAYNVALGTQTTLTTSQLSNPNGVAVDGTGAVYIVDTGNGRIIKIDNQGNETTVISGVDAPTSIAVDTQGDVFYADAGNGGEVTVLSQGFSGNAVSLGTQMGTLYDMAVDAAGRLYISTPNGDTLISPDGSTSGYGGGANYGMALDLAGNIYTTQPSGGSVAVTNRSVSNFILSTVVDTTVMGGDTISNTGNTLLTLSNIAISGTVFTNDPSSQCVAGQTLAPGNTCGTEVDFTPTAAQSYQESYTVTSNSLNVTTSTNVDTLYGNGTGVPSVTALAINPSATVVLGQPVVLTATVTAQTDPPTPTGTVTFYNGSTVLGTGTLIASGASGVATYTTSSTAFAAGSYSITAVYGGDSVYAASTSSAQTLTVVSGGLTFVPATLSFGSQMVGTTGAAQTITVTNTSGSELRIVEDGDSDPQDFGFTQTCGGVINAGSNCTVTVTFHPMSAGAHSQNISFTDDASGSPQTVVTTGTGVAPPATTTTTLTATPATVAYETPVTLTANVYEQDNLTSGQVIFCDTTAAFCNANFNLGVAQLTSNGTAVLSVRSGTIGTHSYTATYLGGNVYAQSTSSAQTVTVTGIYPTTTAIAATGTDGSYNLTGTVVGFGTSAAQPRGSLPFLDTSNGNASVATGILGFATPGFTESPSSTSPYTVGVSPYGQATGDFNGDGFLDLVVENYQSQSVSVLLGNGDGTFQPQVMYSVGNLPERVLVADLNGDGKLDLVVANSGSSTLSVLLGNGDGTFQTQITFPCTSPVGLGIMDINHDGYPDVVAGDYYGGTITVLLGNGDGTLQSGVTYATGSAPQTLAEGDFNGDGNIDVVVGNEGGATVGVFLGNGDGTFQTMVTYPVGNSPQGVQVGDFNGDGKQDLAVANYSDGTIGVLLGNGDGTFQAQVTYPVGTGPVGLVIADFNGDGYEDISVGNTRSNTQSVLLGTGEGTFQTQLTFPTGSVPYATAVGDFNGDGYPDISVSNFGDGTTTVLLSQVTQTATAAASVTFSGSATHNVEASFPGDGNFSASVSTTTPLTGGTAASAITLTSTPAAPAVGQAITFTVAVSPVNSNNAIPSGTVTLMNTAVTPATMLGTITLDGTGAGTFSTSSLAQGTYAVTAVYSGDTNYSASTSSVDTFTVSQPAATTTTLSVTSGGSPVTTVASGSVVTLTAAVVVGTAPVSPGEVAFCDATATTCTDIHLLGTAQITSAGTATYRFVPGIGSHSYKAVFLGTATDVGSASSAAALAVTGTYATATTIAQSGVQGNYTLTATTVGISPLATGPTGNVSFVDTSNANAALGSAALGLATKALGFNSSASLTTGASGGVPLVGDFNGDGKLDLAVAFSYTSGLSLFAGNGDGTFAAGTSTTTTGSPRVAAVGDFNGDGIADIAVSLENFDSTAAVVTVLLGTGSGTFTTSTSTVQGLNAAAMLAGDFNGDGLLDLAVVDSSTQKLKVLLGNGDGTFRASGSSIAAAGANASLTMGDFNGDGKLDLVATSFFNGAQVLLGQGDGSFVAGSTLTDGLDGPVAVVTGDFNGDGKADLAIANNTGNTVSIFLGKGDGTFTTGTTPAATQAASLSIGDFNGDRVPDLAVGDESGGALTVLLGKGDGTFTQGGQPNATADSSLVASGDFNGDGVSDIAVSGGVDSGVLLSVPTQTATVSVTGVSPSSAGTHQVVASYPGDANYTKSLSQPTPLLGVPIMVASATTLAITPVAPTVGQNVTFSVAVAGANQTTPVPSGTVTLMNIAATPATVLGTITLGDTGAGSFSTSALPQGMYTVTATYSGDTNYAASTSSVDTFTVSQPAATTTALAVTSGGSAVTTVAAGSVVTLTAAVTAGGNSVSPGQVAFCDATSDICTDTHLLGTVQLVAGDSTSTATYRFVPGIGSHSYKAVFLGTATYSGSSSTATALAVTGQYATTTALASSGVQGSYVLTATLDGLGLGSPSGNVVFTDSSTSTTLGTMPVSGVVRSFVSGSPISAGSSPNQVVVADVNRDGKPDLVLGNQSGTMVTVLIGNGDGTYSALPSFGTNYNGITGLAIADFNGDGRLDIATANGSTVGIFLGNGDGTFGAEQDFSNTASSQGVYAADFNGDGNLDLAVTDSNYGINILIGNGDGTFTQSGGVLATGRGPNFQVAVADFNKDGKLDIAYGNYFDNNVGVLLGNGDGTFQPQTTFAVGAGPRASFTGDFNGDGNPDIVITNGSGASIGILLGNGDGTFQAQQSFAVGSNPSRASVGDLNGDGKLDIAVANENDGTVSVLFGNGDGSFQTQQVLTTGASPDDVAIRDVNGDGSPDLEAVNLGDNTVSVLLNRATAAVSLTGVTLPGTGMDTVVATYRGDTTFSGSSSNTLILPSNTVGPTTTTLAITPVAATVGQSVTFSVAVAGVNQTTPVPTGTVTLMNTAVTPATVLGTITLGAAGTGSFSSTTLPAGTYSVVAAYSGDANYLASTSVAQRLVVSLVTQTITFPVIPNHVLGDPPFTLSATASSGLAVSYAVTVGSATVSGNTVTLTGAGTVTIQASQAGNATYAAATPVSQTFTVSAVPAPTLAGLSPAGVVAGSPAMTVTLTGGNFTATDVVQANGAALTTTFVNATTLTAVVPANLLAQSGTVPISVTDSATGEASGAVNFVVAVAPVVVFTGPSTASSDQQPMLTFQLKQPYLVPIDCVLTLAFTPATATGIDDQAVQFSTGGRTISFTVPAGSTTTPTVQFQTGTVAGTVTVTLGIAANGVNVTPSSVAPIVVVLPEVVPQVMTATVSRTGAGTSSALTVTVTGFSNTREVKSAIFHFTPTPGNTIEIPDFTIDVTDIFATWFSNEASYAYGSSFTYTQPFSLNADPSTVQSVTVTLVNGVGSSVAQTSE